MFFSLSKMLWPLIQPIYHIAFVVLLSPILAAIGWRKTSIALGFYGTIVFFIFGMMPTGYNMLVYLERQYERPVLRSNYIPHGVIVLGGAFNNDLTQHHGQAMAGSALERMTTFVAIANRYKDSETKLVFSGGSTSTKKQSEGRNNMTADPFTDSDSAALFFLEQGFELENFIFESKARNTHENVIYSKALLNPKKGERWIVITSAYHMPRAMNIFDHYDWKITAFPVDFQTDLKYKWMPNFSILNNFMFSQTAIHEFIGNVVYYMTNKAASILP